ncbi:carbonic anhydrase 6-like isoform X2 [Anthonomus grandis grandis]|uniref:carbonic anhydrase 6-like isoform X2 n=1 Tax=Anthonomus grandis grandis TaxID=2921223 RepID=UPI00216513EB|nr:carbonic anhydrase 6-like isoform X2 [Anthonomus grandis grandis]
MHLKSPKKKSNWPKLCYYGKLQSPINLDSRFAYAITLPPLKLENFKKMKNLRICHTGTSVSVNPDICPCLRPKISGCGLNGVFYLDHLYFHWPSEHFLDGLQYDLEAHFVFVNEKYQNFIEAVKNPLALTVFTVLYTQTTSTRSKNFSVLANAIKEFLPYDHENFYKYTGSLTTKTEGCIEYVNWIVLKNIANIGILDLKNLSHIMDSHGKIVTENNRELQDLNNRIIYTRLIL